MVATQYNLQIEQRGDFKRVILVKDKNTGLVRDISGYTPKLEIRDRPGGVALESLTAPVSLDTGIDMSAASTGFITFYISKAKTGAYTWLTAQYDMYIESPSGFREWLLEGLVTVAPRVTT